jgi:hypothetical protein
LLEKRQEANNTLFIGYPEVYVNLEINFYYLFVVYLYFIVFFSTGTLWVRAVGRWVDTKDQSPCSKAKSRSPQGSVLERSPQAQSKEQDEMV